MSSQLFNIESVSKTNSKKFKTTANRYLIKVNDIPPQQDIPSALRLLRQILNDLVDQILHELPQHDMVRLVISSPFLDYPMSIPFVLRGNFDIDRILEEVERVIQSQFRWLLEGDFSLTLYHAAMPNGGLFEFRLKGRGL